ncbi:MAG: SGNH/GDSL hydrolase family protein [Clostridia bacterium]|nr:SGNH/GDSL hydrolase family protein [Clostridia bacterium]
MKKIKFIVKLIIFICIFSVLLVSVSYIVRPQSDMKDRFAGFYSEPKDTIDAVMIGASSVSPLLAAPYIWNEYGITTYPLSTNAQPAAGIKYIIEEASKSQEDCLFMVDATMFMVEQSSLMTEPRIRNVVDNMKYSFTRIRAINEMVEDKGSRIDYYFDISKYHSAIFGENGVKAEDIKYFNFQSPSEYKGYLFVEAVDIFEPVDLSNITEEKPIPEDSEAELKALMDYCEANEVNILFFINPYAATEINKQEHNYIKSIVEQRGFSFINFNDFYEEMDINFGKDLYNVNHMNVYGAEKFSSFLGRYLIENYAFEDKRGNEDYADWDEAYIAWDKRAIEAKQKTDENLGKIKKR